MYKEDKTNLSELWDIPIQYHPTNTGIILINIPGAGGSIEGYKNKYTNLGNYIQKKSIASFVRIPNEKPQDYELTARTIINYCLENSKAICGTDSSEIWLMGFSAGAGAILLTGWEYPEVKKILAVSPWTGGFEERERLKKNLPEYKNDLFIVIGDKDDVIYDDTMDFIVNNATSVSNLKTLIIPNCDHQLTGEDNSKILSKLPEYFFLGEYKDLDFPNKEEGFVLLD